MEKKFTTVQIEVKEEGDQGLVRAVFATLNVIDKDGDVTLPGAFGNQQVKLAAWGHNWGDLPVGRGAIKEEGESAVFDGRFFLDTEAGREHFLTLKNLADLQEWSYGFQVRDSAEGEFEGQQVRFLKDLLVHEVSPVMVGAGMGTRTVAMKGDKAAIASHQTAKAPEDAAWSRPNLSDFTDQSWEDLSEAEKRKIAQAFVWAKDMPPESFGDLKGPHHLPDGSVVLRGVIACAGRRGQMDIPEGDMAGVMRHLAGHYAQFDREPPWEGTRALELVDQGDFVMEEVQAFIERAQSVAEELEKDGRLLTGSKRERLVRLADLAESVRGAIQVLLTKTEQPAPERLVALVSEFQRIEAAINRLG